MLKINFFIYSFLILSFKAYALPDSFEVWFLSTPKTSMLKNLEVKMSPAYAQSSLQCQPMGEFCFDPQVGLYKKDEQFKVSETVENNLDEKEKYDFIEPAKSIDRSLVDCDKSNFFDIFCGKSKAGPSVAQTPLEVWVDVSSTMNQVDYSKPGEQCIRESFLRSLNQTCPLNQKMKVYYFEEFRKEAGNLNRVCQSGGLNNMDRIIADLEKSKARKVIIVTDIFEAREKFLNKLDLLKVGLIRGIDKPMYAKDLKGKVKGLRKNCL